MAENLLDLRDYRTFNLLLQSYGGRIMMLALATCNESRTKEIRSVRDLYQLCSQYLEIPCSISDQAFLDSEARAIVDSLTTNTSIPAKYITFDLIRAACTRLFICRGIGIQHQNHLSSLEELYRDYEILRLIDADGRNMATDSLQAAFGLPILQIIRSGVCLFSVALVNGKNGLIDFDRLGCEPSLTAKLGVDVETCRKVATAISCKESALRADWYEAKVCTVDPMYQAYVPDPLRNLPLVHRDKDYNKSQFLIPSPFFFIRGFRQAIFSKLFTSARKAEAGQLLGDAVEKHIKAALEHIFGAGRVEKLTDSGRKADFHIKLDQIDLIVEIKSHVGDFTSTAVMSPVNLHKVWKPLHEACLQCSASVARLPASGRLKVALVVVADHMTAEGMPFHTFAEESGLFRDLGLQAVEFLTWSGLEYSLSGTSVKQFEQALIDKWSSPPTTPEAFMSLSFPRDEPAHKYEHLEEAQNQIFART